MNCIMKSHRRYFFKHFHVRLSFSTTVRSFTIIIYLKYKTLNGLLKKKKNLQKLNFKIHNNLL